MTDPQNSSHRGHHDGPAGDDPDKALSARLDQLDASLSKVRAKPEDAAPKGRDTSSSSGVALAFRLGAEFVSGVLVGSAIGYGIDRLFSITPWGLIAFTLVGFGAGVVNMMRAAGEGSSRKTPRS